MFSTSLRIVLITLLAIACVSVAACGDNESDINDIPEPIVSAISATIDFSDITYCLDVSQPYDDSEWFLRVETFTLNELVPNEKNNQCFSYRLDTINDACKDSDDTPYDYTYTSTFGHRNDSSISKTFTFKGKLDVCKDGDDTDEPF